MDQHIIPDYEGNSIVNLMSSILNKYGGSSVYPTLKVMDSLDLNEYDPIILFVIDGLGYNFLRKYGKDTILFKNLKGKITSVFPTTTASAMTSFYTGLGVQNHAVPAWYTYLKELGVISVILPMEIRGLGSSIITENVKSRDILQFKSNFTGLYLKRTLVLPDNLTESHYNQTILSNNTKYSFYSSLDSFFNTILKTLKKKTKLPKFILGYWGMLDSYFHKFGSKNPVTPNHLYEIDQQLQNFLDKLGKINSVNPKVIVTADHGLINTERGHNHFMHDHPSLEECLVMPLSGEARTPFFYVRPSKVEKFESYMANNLSKYGKLMKCEDIINQNYFGKGPVNPRLIERIGDYIMIMNDDYTLRDKTASEIKINVHNGNHGSLSEDETYVPLIYF